MIKPSTGMLLDGAFATENIDSSGEVVSISGMDISTMEEGRGTVNYEHKGEDDGGFGKETVGKVVFAKKVLKESDCDNARERLYWDKVGHVPFLYGVVRLFDAAGHDGAKALAAAIRDQVANDEPILLMWSIEGTTTRKTDNKIAESIAKRVALTWKACNKTAFSGLLADPNAPEGFAVTKAEAQFIDPEFAPLGGAVELECNPCFDPKEEASLRLVATAATLHAVRKAIDAGNYDAAPSTLTGGAALQREEFVRNNARAVLRDWGDRKFSRGEFKAFAKAKLPEVSDSFLDHFSDIAEAYSVKKALAKALPGKPKTAKPKTAKPALTQEPKHAVIEDISDADEAEPGTKNPGGRNIPYGTFRGQPMKPNKMTRPTFDAKQGILHTPVGSFKAYLPSHDGPEAAANYEKILSHPEIENAMDHAMTNWSKVHKLLKAGQLPPEVVMHAVMFAQLSPNKAVPTQEIQYARLVDAMDATGLDPRDPNFHEIEEPWRHMDQPATLPHVAREEFARNPAYYTGGKIGVERDAAGNKLGEPSDTGRYPGELLSTRPLYQDFLSRATKYHLLHDHLAALVNKHRTNGLDAVSELMSQKVLKQRHDSIRYTAKRLGKPDPGPYPGIEVPGLKVKTGLYTWGMMGNGDSIVPDTHQVRALYGLDVNKDADTIGYLKNLHWRPTNIDRVMRPINEWYLNNHPAVRYTLNHPKWGSTFERPQDALFPAFWRHWLTIKPHEEYLGLPNYSEQAGTTHAPFWEAIAPHVDKLVKAEGGDDCSVPLRTALVHQQYVKDYGEVPALFLYYHHLVPHLLDAAAQRRRFGDDLQFMAKARLLEAGLVELRKDIETALNPESTFPEIRKIGIKIAGRVHPAGRFMIHDGKLSHLEDYHGLLASMLPEGDIDATTISRLHGLEWSPKLSVADHAPPGLDQAVGKEESGQPVPVQMPDEPARPASVFEYHRPGMTAPHIIEFSNGGAALDGNRLDDAELALIHSNVKNGLATLRYHRRVEPGALSKAMDIEEAIQHLRLLEARGHVPHEVVQTFVDHALHDPLVPGVGNKYSWEKFKLHNRPGVYVSMDANDFKTVNDKYGHQVGDDSITATGGALRDAAAKVGTGKLFRAGGDEFVAHFPSFEEAAHFARHAQKNLDQIPPINGVHRTTMSMGFGPNYQAADSALGTAKLGKFHPVTKERMFPPGRVPHLTHSVVPGAEGSLSAPAAAEAPPATSLPAPAKTP